MRKSKSAALALSSSMGNRASGPFSTLQNDPWFSSQVLGNEVYRLSQTHQSPSQPHYLTVSSSRLTLLQRQAAHLFRQSHDPVLL